MKLIYRNFNRKELEKEEEILFSLNDEDNNRIISILFEFRKNKSGRFFNFSYEDKETENKYIKQGLGKRLIEEVLEVLKEKGFKKVSLFANAYNRENDNRLSQRELIRFYRKRGFKRKKDENLIKSLRLNDKWNIPFEQKKEIANQKLKMIKMEIKLNR